MEVADFQKRLQELCEFAEGQGNRLTTSQVREYFDASTLEREQLIRLLQYLRAKGIEIDTDTGGGSETGAGVPEIVEESIEIIPGTRAAMTQEDRAYLENYLSPFSAESESADEEVFRRLSQGDSMAKQQLLMRYLPVVARMAAEYNSEEILLADLIQELNLVLIEILGTGESDVVRDDAWVQEQLLQGVRKILMDASDQKIQDQALVSRVEKLEEAVRELTDEEDQELKFTVEELAVILDMKVEEIRDILRLTGDDK